MAKMGYILGEGLGKDSLGRVEPVQARIIPKGTTLDKVMEINEKGGNKDNLKVRVLYSNPMYRKMQPCNFYLQDKCTFGESCRFSHGEKVKFSDLEEYLEPDFGSTQAGHKCLCRSEKWDNLWQLVEVTSVCQNENKVAVKLLQTGVELAVDFDNILALPQCDAASPVPEEQQFSYNDTDFAAERNLGEKGKNLANWEQHTRGIGSKLMAKMGYILGEGLGKDSLGRVEPVQARIIPKGATLDKVMAMSEKGGNKDNLKLVKQQKRKEALRKKRLSASQARNAIESGIFDFINRKLAANSNDEKKEDCVKSESNKGLNVKLFKIDESLKESEKEVHHLKKCLVRNETKDPILAKQYKQRLESTQNIIDSLKNQRIKVQSEQRSRKDKTN